MEFTRLLTYSGANGETRASRIAGSLGRASRVLLVGESSTLDKGRLISSWARHRHDVAFNAETYPSIYYDALTLPTPNEHLDQETESRIFDGKLVSNLVLIEVRNHRKLLVNYGSLSQGDSVVFVFSFNSFASFEAVRGCVTKLRGRDLEKRPVVAIIGTAAAPTDREVNEAEVGDLKAALSMFYWDVDQEEDAFPVMDAIASAQRSYFVPSREEKPSGGLREKIVSALLSFLQRLSR